MLPVCMHVFGYVCLTNARMIGRLLFIIDQRSLPGKYEHSGSNVAIQIYPKVKELQLSRKLAQGLD
jgi:hypothetical protein